MKYPEQIIEVIKFGEHLRHLREAKGLSQQMLADMANLDKKTLQKIELGRLNPSLATLVSLGNALEMPLKELVDF